MKLSEHNLRWIVIGLCLLATIRVFVFAAAFPFFNNVDEQAHVDLVVKYAHAKPPRNIEHFASEAALCFAVYGTPEYFVTPEQYGGQYPPPNWLLPREQLQKILDDEIPFWESRLNHESGEPPLYYALVGGWMNVGRAVGLRGLSLLYWVRFLNVGVAAALVWLVSRWPGRHSLTVNFCTSACPRYWRCGRRARFIRFKVTRSRPFASASRFSDSPGFCKAIGPQLLLQFGPGWQSPPLV
jgi:hypothetical protein